MTTLTQEALIEQLSAIVGTDKVRTDADSLETFGKDWTKIYPPKPSAIVFPKTTEQVQKIVLLANEQSLSLVPSGGRTGLSAGAVAANGEVVISFDYMNQISEFNAIDRTVKCELVSLPNSCKFLLKSRAYFIPSILLLQVRANLAVTFLPMPVVLKLSVTV